MSCLVNNFYKVIIWWHCQLHGFEIEIKLKTYTPCLKETSHLWLAITLAHMNKFWYFFDKASNQKTLYYATSNNLCFCTTWQIGETRKSHFSLNWTVLHAQCTCALYSWKKKLSSVMCLILRLTFVVIVRYLINTIHWVYSRLDEEQLPSFTQRLTPWQTWITQNMCVTDSRMLCSFPRSCLVHSVDRLDSEGWFSSDQVIFLTVSLCIMFWWKSM